MSDDPTQNGKDKPMKARYHVLHLTNGKTQEQMHVTLSAARDAAKALPSACVCRVNTYIEERYDNGTLTSKRLPSGKYWYDPAIFCIPA